MHTPPQDKRAHTITRAVVSQRITVVALVGHDITAELARPPRTSRQSDLLKQFSLLEEVYSQNYFNPFAIAGPFYSDAWILIASDHDNILNLADYLQIRLFQHQAYLGFSCLTDNYLTTYLPMIPF